MSKKDSDLLELHLVRHGKSSWEYSQTADIDRPLTERGIENATAMAKRFFAGYPIPDVIYTSPAIRALHTAVIFARNLHLPFSCIRISENIYTSDEEGLLDLIRDLPPLYKRLMFFGHNPTFTDLANHFLRQKIDNLPTAGMVSMAFNAPDWNAVSPGTLVSEYFDYPKKIH
jgi:phosphohistidine phosphatase